VLAEEVVIGVEDECAIAGSLEFLSEDNYNKDEVFNEPSDDEEILPDEEPPDDNLSDDKNPTGEPSEENPSDDENPSDEENPDDGDEIYLGEDNVDKLREDTVSPAEDKETDHKDNSKNQKNQKNHNNQNNSQKHNSQKHYTNNINRNLPETGENENLIIWKIFLLLSAAGTILLIIFAYHIACTK
jgi:uncharacterized surface anchored protein